MLSKNMRIKDPETRKLLASSQLSGIVKLLDATVTESLHLDSYGKESRKITIEYTEPTKK